MEMSLLYPLRRMDRKAGNKSDYGKFTALR